MKGPRIVKCSSAASSMRARAERWLAAGKDRTTLQCSEHGADIPCRRRLVSSGRGEVVNGQRAIGGALLMIVTLLVMVGSAHAQHRRNRSRPEEDQQAPSASTNRVTVPSRDCGPDGRLDVRTKKCVCPSGYGFKDGKCQCPDDKSEVAFPDGPSCATPAFPTVRLGGAVDQVVAANDRTCVRLVNGQVKCWGRNDYGQLGDGTSAQRRTPDSAEELRGAIDLALGGLHGCALFSNGSVKCWGNNEQGQVGGGSAAPVLRPVEVAGLENVVQIAAGYRHSCAVLVGGVVKCWGYNKYGQLGDGSLEDRRHPVVVADLAGAVEVSAGGLHTCARLEDGTVKCWGNNSAYQLGDGTSEHRATATAVPGLTGVVQITLGSGESLHTCARLESGAVVCWGRNALGQLGDGTTTSRQRPTAVPELSNVAQLALNIGHTCASLTDGTVRCWGYNIYGQLGDGTTGARLSPAVVQNVADAVQISVGPGHTCALRKDHTVACWGANPIGELGVATTDACSLVSCSRVPMNLRQ